MKTVALEIGSSSVQYVLVEPPKTVSGAFILSGYESSPLSVSKRLPRLFPSHRKVLVCSRDIVSSFHIEIDGAVPKKDLLAAIGMELPERTGLPIGSFQTAFNVLMLPEESPRKRWCLYVETVKNEDLNNALQFVDATGISVDAVFSQDTCLAVCGALLMKTTEVHSGVILDFCPSGSQVIVFGYDNLLYSRKLVSWTKGVHDIVTRHEAKETMEKFQEAVDHYKSLKNVPIVRFGAGWVHGLTLEDPGSAQEYKPLVDSMLAKGLLRWTGDPRALPRNMFGAILGAVIG